MHQPTNAQPTGTNDKPFLEVLRDAAEEDKTKQAQLLNAVSGIRIGVDRASGKSESFVLQNTSTDICAGMTHWHCHSTSPRLDTHGSIRVEIDGKMHTYRPTSDWWQSHRGKRVRLYYRPGDLIKVQIIAQNYLHLGIFELTHIDGQPVKSTSADQHNEQSDRERMAKIRAWEKSQEFTRKHNCHGYVTPTQATALSATEPEGQKTLKLFAPEQANPNGALACLEHIAPMPKDYVEDFFRASKLDQHGRDRMTIGKLYNACTVFMGCDDDECQSPALRNLMDQALHFARANQKASVVGADWFTNDDVLKTAVYLEAAGHTDDESLPHTDPVQASQTPNGTVPSDHEATRPDGSIPSPDLIAHAEKRCSLNTDHSNVANQEADVEVHPASCIQDSTEQFAFQPHGDVVQDSFPAETKQKSLELHVAPEHDAQSAKAIEVCTSPVLPDQVDLPSESPASECDMDDEDDTTFIISNRVITQNDLQDAADLADRVSCLLHQIEGYMNCDYEDDDPLMFLIQTAIADTEDMHLRLTTADIEYAGTRQNPPVCDRPLFDELTLPGDAPGGAA